MPRESTHSSDDDLLAANLPRVAQSAPNSPPTNLSPLKPSSPTAASPDGRPKPSNGLPTIRSSLSSSATTPVNTVSCGPWTRPQARKPCWSAKPNWQRSLRPSRRSKTSAKSNASLAITSIPTTGRPMPSTCSSFLKASSGFTPSKTARPSNSARPPTPAATPSSLPTAITWPTCASTICMSVRSRATPRSRSLTRSKDEKEERNAKIEGNLLNGEVDWVYAEELSVRSNYFWSPDGKSIVFLHMDETRVPTYPITDWMPTHPTVDMEKYPQAGDPNPVVRLGVVSASGGDTKWISLTDDHDTYIPRFGWVRDGILWAEVLNRAQDNLDLYFDRRPLRTLPQGPDRVHSRRLGQRERRHDYPEVGRPFPLVELARRNHPALSLQLRQSESAGLRRQAGTPAHQGRFRNARRRGGGRSRRRGLFQLQQRRPPPAPALLGEVGRLRLPARLPGRRNPSSHLRRRRPALRGSIFRPHDASAHVDLQHQRDLQASMGFAQRGRLRSDPAQVPRVQSRRRDRPLRRTAASPRKHSGRQDPAHRKYLRWPGRATRDQ